MTKYLSVASQVLLGVIFTVFGLNGFLHFLPMQMPSGDAGAFAVLLAKHLAPLVFSVQLLAGVLLLVGRYVPLAVALLAPILVNILAYHVTMSPDTIAPAIVATILWLVVAYNARANFAGVFDPNVRRSDSPAGRSASYKAAA
jgi:uncharacterized membrane protein YphA (DoxX/SURF4 family)